MRNIASVVKMLLGRDDTNFYYLVEMILADGTISRETTASFAITANGNVFTPNTGLQNVEPPKLSTVVDREAYKITYVDPASEKLAMFERGLTGANVTVWAAFINTTGAPLAATGGMFLDGEVLVNDLLIAYRGTVDTQGYTINPQDGTIIAIIECSSPMAGLGVTKAMYTSKDSARERLITDTAYDEIYEGSIKVGLLWGKKEV